MYRPGRVVLATVLLGGLLASAACRETTRGTEEGRLTVREAWARPVAIEGGNSAAYMVLANGGARPVRVVSVRTPAANEAGLHRTIIDADGLARMRPLAEAVVPAGDSLVFEPGGDHVMLVGVRALMAGDAVEVTFLTADGEEIVARAVVRDF